MKEFYIQCLKDLYALTGIKQVQWMLMDTTRVDPNDKDSQTNGERNFDLCVAGMIEQSKSFSYIPEEAQQKIILKMMVEDKDYEMMNSRTVYKWLNMFRDSYFTQHNTPTETPRVVLTPEASARVDKLLEQYKTSLTDFRPRYGNLAEEKAKITEEDKDRIEGKKSYAKEYYTQRNQKQNLRTFNVDGIEIPAKDEDDARKQYVYAFGKDPESISLPSDKKHI